MKKDIKLRWIIISIIVVSILSTVGTCIYVIMDSSAKTKKYIAEHGLTQDSSNGTEPYTDSSDDPLMEGEYVEPYVPAVDSLPYDLTLNTDYLTEFHENLNEEVSYDVQWEFDSYTSPYGNVKWTISYYTLDGEFPNLDTVNSVIYDNCAYLSEQYMNAYGLEDYSFTSTYDAKGISYVTYNNEKFISIMSIQEYSLDGSGQYILMNTNIDLTTGKNLTCRDIFAPDADFARRFIDQSNLQNGDSEIFDRISEEQILEYLTDEDYAIIFMSEKGLEVGFNYVLQNENGTYSQGYITITLNDYEQYITPEFAELMAE